VAHCSHDSPWSINRPPAVWFPWGRKHLWQMTCFTPRFECHLAIFRGKSPCRLSPSARPPVWRYFPSRSCLTHRSRRPSMGSSYAALPCSQSTLRLLFLFVCALLSLVCAHTGLVVENHRWQASPKCDYPRLDLKARRLESSDVKSEALQVGSSSAYRYHGRRHGDRSTTAAVAITYTYDGYVNASTPTRCTLY
jgi:hypothetical protein